MPSEPRDFVSFVINGFVVLLLVGGTVSAALHAGWIGEMPSASDEDLDTLADAESYERLSVEGLTPIADLDKRPALCRQADEWREQCLQPPTEPRRSQQECDRRHARDDECDDKEDDDGHSREGRREGRGGDRDEDRDQDEDDDEGRGKGFRGDDGHEDDDDDDDQGREERRRDAERRKERKERD